MRVSKGVQIGFVYTPGHTTTGLGNGAADSIAKQVVPNESLPVTEMVVKTKVWKNAKLSGWQNEDSSLKNYVTQTPYDPLSRALCETTRTARRAAPILENMSRIASRIKVRRAPEAYADVIMGRAFETSDGSCRCGAKKDHGISLKHVITECTHFKGILENCGVTSNEILLGANPKEIVATIRKVGAWVTDDTTATKFTRAWEENIAKEVDTKTAKDARDAAQASFTSLVNESEVSYPGL